MSENPTNLAPGEIFSRRMKDAREAAGIAQTELSRRLEELGYTLKRSAIADIESGRRRVTLDDALAISAALGVAPLHMIVPFEDEDPISTDAADRGIFNAPVGLKVGGIRLLPIEARRWITGRQIYSDADLSQWERYYIEEVPPARRWRVREWRRLLRGERTREKGDALSKPTAEDVEPKMAALVGNRRSLPTWLWVALGGLDPYPEEEE